eukprot:symbB.v1.2.012943.t1/scaffold872.1/size254027/3
MPTIPAIRKASSEGRLTLRFSKGDEVHSTVADGGVERSKGLRLELNLPPSPSQLRTTKSKMEFGDAMLSELRRNMRLGAARCAVLQDAKCRLLLGLRPGKEPEPYQSYLTAWKEASKVHRLPSLTQQKSEEQEKLPREKLVERRGTFMDSKKKVKRRTVTMNFQSGGEPSNLPPASWEKVNSLCPSVQDALDRYYVNTGFIPDHELRRMRVAFQRFSEDNDLYRGQVHEVLTHLCYVPVSEDKATAICKDTNEFSTLDFQDFCDFCERYQNYEREVVRVKIEEWMSREKDEDYEPDAVMEVQGFLKSLGIICLKDAIQEILVLGGLKDYTCTKPEELLRFLAAYRAVEGFTREDLDRIQRIFASCEAEPQPKTAQEMRSERHIKASQLCPGLLKFGGLYCAEHLRELVDKMEESMEGDKIIPVQFYEFLVCCRRLKDMMLTAAVDEFDTLDADEDGLIEGEELREFCKPLGFTLSSAEWEELLEEQGVSPDDDIDFQAAYTFLQGVQAKNGFTQEEIDELEEAFHRFSDTTGELQNLKVQDLLKWIGFQTSVEDVQAMDPYESSLVALSEEHLNMRVDFNANKTMDVEEFLRLMRLQREITLEAYTAAYARNRLYARNAANPSEVLRVLEAAGHSPNVLILDQAIQLVKDSGDYDEEQPSLSFEGFLKVADFCRKTIPKENRKFAHFNLQEILTSFNSQDKEKKGWISMGSFLWLLGDTDLQVNSVNGRARTYEQLQRAREAASEAGVPRCEVGGANSGQVLFMPVVHFVYESVKNHNDAVFQREDEALKAVEFSTEEVAQFRELFATLVQQHQEELEAAARKAREQPKAGRRLSAVQAAQVLAEAEEAMRLQQERELTLGSVIKKLTNVDRVPPGEIVKLCAMMGVKMSSNLRQELLERTIHFSDVVDEGLDFPGFLQLMNWMVRSNFGNINGAAEKTVKSKGLGLGIDADRERPGLQAGLVFGKFGHMAGVTVRTRRTIAAEVPIGLDDE